MAKRILVYQLWNKREVFITIGVIAGILVAIYLYIQFPTFLHQYKLSKFDRETFARILTIEQQNNIVQSEYGNYVKTTHIKIQYSFSANRKKYVNTNLMENSSLLKEALKTILKEGKTTRIMYLSTNPNESMIVLTKTNN